MTHVAPGRTTKGRGVAAHVGHSALSAVRSWRFWRTFLLACALSFGLERVWERLMQSEESERSVPSSLMNAGFIYQRLLTTAPRESRPRYTAIVAIDPQGAPPSIGVTNVCEQR